MGYSLRYYQQEGVDKAVAFFRTKTAGNAIEVFPTGAGKSLIIANIALRLDEPILVFQPSKEILEQNYAKCASYGLVPCSETDTFPLPLVSDSRQGDTSIPRQACVVRRPLRHV